MPANLGAVLWPRKGQSHSVLVDETDLPLIDEGADRILLVHMLEWSEKPRELLSEIWRVLAPSGRLLVVVPTRRGLWARLDTTPFGYGSPYSRSQLSKLLKETMFSPEEARAAVMWVASVKRHASRLESEVSMTDFTAPWTWDWRASTEPDQAQ